MNWNPKVVLPLAVFAVGALGAAILIGTRPQVETRRPEAPPPLVRVMPVEAQSLQLKVRSQGTVAPRTQAALVSQVAGQVISVSPAFAGGGFFEKGDVLVTIDPRDYELAVARAQAQVAQAEVRLTREEEESALARQEWERVGRGVPTPLALRTPQLAEARAALGSARAVLQQAELNLERTRIIAPYAGRVRTISADVGQVVAPGTPLARIYAVDYAEVRLPVPDDQLAYLDLSLDFRGHLGSAQGPEVVLRGSFAGGQHRWMGRIVRAEGEIDSRTRMVTLVARVKDPYGPGGGENRPPLAVGLFVEAEISGRRVENVAVLPRSVLRTGGRVLVADDRDRLHFRGVDVLRADAGCVVIRSGLSSGERVCLSPLDAVVDGMRVRTVLEADAVALKREGGGR